MPQLPISSSPTIPTTTIPQINATSSTHYNDFIDPHTYHKPINAYKNAVQDQRLLIPSISPIGIDSFILAAEHESYLNARINQRISELEQIPFINKVRLNDPNNNHLDHLEYKRLIEYKSFKLSNLRTKLRNKLFFAMARNTKLICSVDHASCRSVLNYHLQVEKEEQKRAERVSKERLSALKNDDEEAYLKLIDEAKDTRITHLLKQTDSYLDSLAQAVVAQQNDDSHNDPSDGKKIDYYQVAHKIREEVIQPSIMIGGTLKDYQIKGLQWMVSLYNNRLNGLLADEMGLGKTIQTISLITYLIEMKRQNGPFLIVVPLSTLTNWTMEFEKWAPSVMKCVYKGTPSVRKELQRRYIKHINFQVLLTTYEYIIKDKSVLSKIRWVYVIIDEGHRMKNANSKISMILANTYQCRYRLILTGTPLQNNLPELWSLLNFLLPKIFNSVKSFDEWFNTPFANTGGQDKIALNEEESLLIIRRLHKVLRPFLLRRLKKDVESELPDKVERVIKCKLSSLQLKLYNQMKKLGVLFVNNGEKGKTGIKGLNNTIMQLRKICNHPFVFEEVEGDFKSNFSNELLYRVSGKFELLDRILPKFSCTNHRAEDRSELLKQFNAPDSPYFIFLLSTRAGGLDLQAQDRAHRIGQTREVQVLRLISQKSIEETILARAQYKLDIDGKVIQAGKFDNKSTAEEREAYLLERFKNMDIERDQKEEAEWRMKGGKGRRPGRLIEESELPSIYTKDYETVINYDDSNVEYGRGQRVRGNIHYDDGLTEEQWVNALEDEDIELEELIVKKQAAKRRRLEKKYKKATVQQGSSQQGSSQQGSSQQGSSQQGSSQQESSQQPNVYSNDVNINSTNGKKKRGRPRKDAQKILDGNNNNSGLTPKPSKKKGKTKREFDSYDEKTINESYQDQSKKKRKISKSNSVDVVEVDDVPPQIREKMRNIFMECYSVVENLMDESDGEPRQRAYLFLTLPKIKDYPLYFQIIKNPIAMDTIKKRIKGVYYKTIKQCKEDWYLMFNNAKTFNEEGSQIYNDANKMQEVLDKKFEELCPGGELSNTSTEDKNIIS
ncbi:5663_t:CDS:10 [Entrophospora sp. SA101]|nr:5663_t:CDS:10 [Entrophospora sp. SA101]